MNSSSKFAALATAACIVGLSMTPAQAGLIVQAGNHPQIDDNVISSGSCAAHIDGPALTVEGCLNGSHSTLVDFTSDENIVFSAGGQANIDNTDGGFSRLKISLPGYTFTSLILNIEATADGKVSFTDGLTTSALFDLDQNGSNFFTITGGPFNFISYTAYDTTGLIETDLVDHSQQHRIGGAAPAPVPEPSTLAIFGVGLLGGLGFLTMRKRQAA